MLTPVPSGDVLTVLTGHTMPVTAGVFPPPLGRQILTASLDSTLILWNPTTSAPVFKLGVFHSSTEMADPAEHGITALAVSPNGSLAAVGSASGKVKLVSLPKGEIVGTLEGHTNGESIEALAFVDVLGGAGGGKGVVLVSGATDAKGFVWDCATGRVRAELEHDVSTRLGRGFYPAGGPKCSSLAQLAYFVGELTTGTHHVARTAPRAERPPRDVGLGGPDAEDVGRAQWHPRRPPQGPRGRHQRRSRHACARR